MDSVTSLRAILAKQAQTDKHNATKKTAPSTPYPTIVPPLSSVPLLRYPAVDASGSSCMSAMAPSSLRGHLTSYTPSRGTDAPEDADKSKSKNSRNSDHQAPSKTAMKQSNLPPPSNQTVSFSHPKRTITWSYQTPNNPAPSQSAFGSSIASSILAFTSTWKSAGAPTPPLRRGDVETYTNAAETQNMNDTTKAARTLTPFRGSIWEPEDDEWMDVDASKVVQTFQASYRLPLPANPLKSTTLSYLATALRSVLASPTKRAQDELMRGEERERDQIDELRNTYYYDPEGDLNDQVVADVFLGTCYFPERTAASPRSMHVINLDAYFRAATHLLPHARPRLCDAVATVLSHTSTACLEAFLDPTVQEFTYRRELDRSKGGMIFVIHRKGNEVVCGAYHNLGFKLLWKLYVKSLVSVTGQWREAYATVKPGEMRIDEDGPEWGTIQTDFSDQNNNNNDNLDAPVEVESRKFKLSPSKKAVEISEPIDDMRSKLMLYHGRVLARYLLWDIWFAFDKMYECRATWEADGVTSDVRLRRAVVGSGDDEED